MNPRLIVFSCAVFALAAIAAAPLVPAIPFAFSMVCHQSPARCFHWIGGPMPVCARCLGVYVGLLFAAAFPLRLPRPVLYGLAAINVLDWIAGVTPNVPRFALAVAFSWLAAGFLLATHERAASN